MLCYQYIALLFIVTKSRPGINRTSLFSHNQVLGCSWGNVKRGVQRERILLLHEEKYFFQKSQSVRLVWLLNLNLDQTQENLLDLFLSRSNSTLQNPRFRKKCEIELGPNEVNNIVNPMAWVSETMLPTLRWKMVTQLLYFTINSQLTILLFKWQCRDFPNFMKNQNNFFFLSQIFLPIWTTDYIIQDFPRFPDWMWILLNIGLFLIAYSPTLN